MTTRISVLVTLVLFGLATSTFAQATFSVGSVPVTTATATGQTERVGDVTLSQISGTSALGTILLGYQVPITVGFFQVSVTGTGGYAGQVSLLAVNNASGILVIAVPAGVSGGTITVAGVRVALAGSGLTFLQANISATGNAITAGQTSVIVLHSIASGLESAGVSPGVEGAIDAATGAVLVEPVASVREGYLDAFKPQDSGTTTSVMVRFRLSANPPPGVTIYFPPTVDLGSSTWTTAWFDGSILGTTVAITSTSTSRVVYYRIVSGTNPTVIETLAVPVALGIEGSAPPFEPTTITYTCSLAPNGTALDSNNNVIVNPIPRFAVSEVGPAILFQISPPPPVEIISIDVKPEDHDNVINPKSKGIIPVAILTTDSFDASIVNPSAAFFGPKGVEAPALWAEMEDLNKDGRLDMLLFFATEKTGIVCGVTTVTLKAQTLGGLDLQGTDTLRTVPCH